MQESIRKGEFREDLFYRLNVIPIELPPLRERGADILALANYYISFYSAEEGVASKRFSPASERCVLSSNWPGNIRELKNIMERLSIMVRDELIEEDHVPEALSGRAAGGLRVYSAASDVENFRDARAEFERLFILQKLKDNEFNISRTAERIGLERSHLYRKLKTYGIETDVDKRQDGGDET